MKNYCLIGNCQARTLKEIALARGLDAKHFLVCSTAISEDAGIAAAKEYLGRHLSRETLTSYLNSGQIRINPAVQDIVSKQYDTYVYNLFHERSQYFVHRETGFIIECSINEITPEARKLLANLNADAMVLKPAHDNYLDRYIEFVSRFMDANPKSRHVIVKRISQHVVPLENRSSLKQ
jgi:hypothetical protein